jgi:microcin C transport system permease protein
MKIAIGVFGFILFLSLTAEFWANSKPIVMKYSGHYYFPAVKRYYPDNFGQKDEVVTNYRAVILKPEDWAIWPVVRWDPLESNKNVDTYPSPPTLENWFGTDDRGRDVLARLIYGFRYSIVFALLCWVATYFLGTVAGAIMGFLGGQVDLQGQRIVEIFDALPAMLLLITFISIFSATLKLLVVFTTVFGWMMISVYMRAEFLRLRRREFVDSARALGASTFRIIFRHILPNALSPILTFSAFTIAGGISSLAALDYLGFGLPPPTPSWGELLNQAQRNFTVAWWLAVYPSAALFISLVVLNFIGEGVRDRLDPRKKR